MTKRAVLLIAIVGVLCFGLWGYVKPVKAVSSINEVMQTPPSEVWVDPTVEEDISHYKTIQAAVNAVASGGVIRINNGIPYPETTITINKPLTILGFGSDTDIPLLYGKIVLQSQGTTPGLVKLFNLRFMNANNAITIGDAPNAVFGEIILSNLTFGSTPPFPDSKAIQTANSVQINKLSILDCLIFAAHGIELYGDIGSAEISRNSFNLTGQNAGRFDAITIEQETKASASINPTGTLTIQGNKIYKPASEDYPYTSAILNQAIFTMTSATDGKKLTATGNTFSTGISTIFDQTQFIQDKIADFVLVNVAPVAEGESVTTTEDTAIAITPNATDVNDDPLTYELVSDPEHGSLSGVLPNLTYTPTTNYFGSDSFTFRANDGVANSNTAAVSITVTAVNDAPATDAQSITTAEDTEKTIKLDATDVDSETLTFSIVTTPMHGLAAIVDDGVAYTPTTDYYGIDNFTFKANDGTTDSNTSTVTVTISAVNDAPTLTTILAKEVNEGETLSFTAAAGDVDLPEQMLIFSLVDGPTGTGINGSTGEFTWMPTEAQGGSIYTMSVCVSDGVVEAPTCQLVTVTVNEINMAPALIEIPSQVVNEGETLSFTSEASDVDLPDQILSFSLEDEPTGAIINTDTGVFGWTPTEAQGGSIYTMSVCVSDGVVEAPTCQLVTVTVNEVNMAPDLIEISGQVVNEGELLTFSAYGSDSDLPLQTLTYSFSGDTPEGMLIDAATGSITWTPTEGQGPQALTVTVCVDDGTLENPTCQTGMVTVNEVNMAPDLTDIPTKNIKEGELLTFTATGNDGDLPAQTFSFNLENAPIGAVIDPATGVFSWTPSEGQGAQIYTLSVCINDGVLVTAVCQELTIMVERVNTQPTLEAVAPQTVNEGELLSFTVVASDTDLPAQMLTYSFSLMAPDGMLIDAATGEVTWTPSEAQGGSLYIINVCVSDGAVETPVCQDVTVTVNEVNLLPTLTEIPAKTVKEGELLTFIAAGSDADLPAQTLSFNLVNAPSGASIDINTGAFTWMPTEEQGPQDYTVEVCVSDGAVTTPTCQDVAVTVNEVDLPPALTEIPDQTVKEGHLLTFSATASDVDIPMQTISFILMNAPTGASINGSTGVFTWTPTEAQGGSSYTVSVCVSDGALNVCHDVAITVEKTNSAPIVGTIPEQIAREGELLTFTVPASDGDMPTQSLSFSMQDAPDGAVIDPLTGVFAWTPGKGQGPQDYTVMVCVSDGTLTTCKEVIIRISSLIPQPMIKIYLPLISR